MFSSKLLGMPNQLIQLLMREYDFPEALAIDICYKFRKGMLVHIGRKG
jgi:hypothetical protein